MAIAPELWRAAFAHRRYALTLLLAHLAGAATHVPAALALAATLTGVAHRDTSLVAAGAVGVVAAAVVRLALSAAESRAATRLGTAVTVDVRDRTLASTLTANRLHDTGSRDGQTLSALTDGVDGTDVYVTRYVPAVVTVLVICPAVVLTLALVSLAAAAAVTVGLIAAVLGPVAWKRSTRRRGSAHWDSYEALAADVLESLRGMKTVRVLGAVPAVRARLRARSDALHRATVSVMRTSLADTAVTDLAIQGGIAVAIGLAVAGYTGPGADTFALYAVLLLASESFRPVRDLARQWHAGYLGLSALPALRALHAFDSSPPPAAQDAPAPATTASVSGGDPPVLALVSVRYRYPASDHDVLAGIDAMLSPGALVVVTGESGAGKSTLFDLLLGHLSPSSGRITMRGRTPGPTDIAVISQRPVLFAGTIRDNLTVGNPRAGDAEIRSACAAAGAAGILAEWGLQAPVSEAGTSLSGGQRQRLAVARALLSGRPVLLADEPTSALDEHNAAQVMDALRDAATDRLVVVVTHRLDVLSPLDRVFLLRGGTLSLREPSALR